MILGPLSTPSVVVQCHLGLSLNLSLGLTSRPVPFLPLSADYALLPCENCHPVPDLILNRAFAQALVLAADVAECGAAATGQRTATVIPLHPASATGAWAPSVLPGKLVHHPLALDMFRQRTIRP